LGDDSICFAILIVGDAAYSQVVFQVGDDALAAWGQQPDNVPAAYIALLDFFIWATGRAQQILPHQLL